MKKVLITGGSRGIGLAAAKRFLDEGFKVINVSRNAEQCELQGENIKNISFDLSEVEKIPELIGQIGEVDVLVNNAGIMNADKLKGGDYPEELKSKILRVNLEAPIALINECSKSMVKKGAGRIVNVTSVAGSTGHPDYWYGASKAALINATKSFAKMLGEHSIVVTSVAPGPVYTDMLEQIPKDRLEGQKSRMIGGRFATPQQIAEIIYWLATSAPDQVNGSSIDANNCAYPR